MDRIELLKALRQNGIRIGEDAGGPDGPLKDVANNVIRSYAFWFKCPGDNMAMILCEKAYEKWKEAST